MSDKAAASGKERKPRQMPSSFTILFGCLLLVAIASWVVSSFSPDVQAATLGNFMASPFLGFESAMQVCVFILVLGGFLGVVQKTGALDTGIAVLVRKLGGNDLLLVPVLMLAFGICGSTYGMLEESVPFYLLLASVTFAMGWDPLVGCMVVLMGCGLGVLGSTVNPFSTGLALDALKAAGIPYDQGLMIGIGLVMFAIAEISGIILSCGMPSASAPTAPPHRSPPRNGRPPSVSTATRTAIPPRTRTSSFPKFKSASLFSSPSRLSS